MIKVRSFFIGFLPPLLVALLCRLLLVPGMAFGFDVLGRIYYILIPFGLPLLLISSFTPGLISKFTTVEVQSPYGFWGSLASLIIVPFFFFAGF